MSLTVSRLSPWVPHWCRRSGCSHAQCSPDMRKTCPSLWPAPPSNRQVESVAPTRSPLVATNQHTQILAVQQVCMQCMFNGCATTVLLYGEYGWTKWITIIMAIGRLAGLGPGLGLLTPMIISLKADNSKLESKPINLKLNWNSVSLPSHQLPNYRLFQ